MVSSSTAIRAVLVMVCPVTGPNLLSLPCTRPPRALHSQRATHQYTLHELGLLTLLRRGTCLPLKWQIMLAAAAHLAWLALHFDANHTRSESSHPLDKAIAAGIHRAEKVDEKVSPRLEKLVPSLSLPLPSAPCRRFAPRATHPSLIFLLYYLYRAEEPGGTVVFFSLSL